MPLIWDFSEYALVKSTAVVKMAYPNVDMAVASIIGCGVMTGYGSVMNIAKVRPDSSVVVLGVGGVGLNVVQSAQLSKASKIIAVDTNPHRLEMAKTFGATHGILADAQDKG